MNAVLTKQTTLHEFLDALASEQPAPGGGGAAALAVALGAALVAMTARLTVGRRKFADVEASMRRTAERADQLRAEALGLVQADADAYGEVMQAFGMPRANQADKAARGAALSESAVAASRVPLRVGSLAAELIELAGRTVETGNPNVISDAGAGAALARAAIRICEMNIDANRGLIADPAVAGELESELAVILAARDLADAPVDRVLGGDHP